MNLETFRLFCLGLPDVFETTPFGPDVLVFKVNNKIFAITSLTNELFQISLKCDPAKAIELREMYDEVVPGWHLNKKHWNTIRLNGRLKANTIKEWIMHSYDLVKTKPKAVRKIRNDSH
jgi:predicted DNA-binding protein (MmcQ/YjbR family)